MSPDADWMRDEARAASDAGAAGPADVPDDAASDPMQTALGYEAADPTLQASWWAEVAPRWLSSPLSLR